MVLIGAVLNACKISQCQYCGAIHELETDLEKKQWSLVSIFLNGAYGCSFPLKKKWATLREKRRRKKGNNNEKIYRV
jgi:hypothetical protein